MDNKSKIIEVITSAVREANQSLAADKKISLDPDAALYGPQGVVDSLTLTLLIVAIEQKLEAVFGSSVTLVNYSLGLSENQAFSSIQALSDHISALMNSSHYAK